MIIKAFKIQPGVVEKIFKKHNVLQEEIHDVLKNDAPIFRRVGGNQYLAIGTSRNRYITIFFQYEEKTKEVEITTAYPSVNKQIKFYKRLKK